MKILSTFLRQIVDSISDKLKRGLIKPIEMVSIHATFLSIILGIFSAYYLYAYSEVRHAQQEVFTEADKINRVIFSRSSYSPESDDIFLANGHDDVHKLQKEISKLIILSSHQPGGIAIGDIAIPKDEAVRAEQILILMNAICHRYPFPKSIERTTAFKPEPIIFKDMSDLRQWLEDIEFVITRLKAITHILPILPNHEINQYLSSLYLREKELIERLKHDNLLKIGGERNPFFLATDFIKGMLQVNDIYEDTKKALRKTDYLENEMMPKTTAIVVMIGGCLVFVFGIILPLSVSNLNPAFYVYIPIIYYAIVLMIMTVNVIAG